MIDRKFFLVYLITLLNFCVSTCSEATVTISNVVCQQQYPWNGKINIEYDFYGGPDDTYVWISATGYDKSNNNKYQINALTGDGAVNPIRPGKNHLIWDAHKDYPNLRVNAFTITLRVINSPKYLVVDLKSGAITYLEAEPNDGWTDEYKTNKMILRYIPSGTFIMGSPEGEFGREEDEFQHTVTITKPFYIGVFEITQEQYALITGTNPSSFEGNNRPVDCISYDMIRGSDNGTGWPANRNVDEESFMGKLRKKTGKLFDLPTEAQWEYACRAGATTTWNNGTDIANSDEDSELNKLGRYRYNQNDGRGNYSQHTVVGSYVTNAWGLYDMHGNVWEWCLDWYDEYNEQKIDPVGANTVGARVNRGGCWYDAADFCRSAVRAFRYPNTADTILGFRVALTQ